MDSELKRAIAAIRALSGDLEKGRLADLSGRLDGCATKWSLEFGNVLAADVGLVITARQRAGGDVVLKLSYDSAEFGSERLALEAFGGRGSVRLLDSAPEYDALLLESVSPGTRLRSVTESGSDEDSCRIATEVATALHVPPTNEQVQHLANAGIEAAETLARYVTLNERSGGPLPFALVERAASLVTELNPSSSVHVVLHGDFHHDNILRSDRAGWLAIDPKGRIGDPAYEFSTLMRNPIDYLVERRNLRSLLKHRAKRLAAFSGCDHDRITSWAIAMAVVAACWQYEDGHTGWEAWLHVAEALA